MQGLRFPLLSTVVYLQTDLGIGGGWVLVEPNHNATEQTSKRRRHTPAIHVEIDCRQIRPLWAARPLSSGRWTRLTQGH